MKRLSYLVTRHPWLFIVFFVLATAAVGSNLRNLEIEPDLKAMLPTDFPARVDMDAIDELFGGTDFIMVVLEGDDVLSEETLGRVKELSRKLARVKGVDRVMSLTTANDIRAEEGMMVVERAVRRVPKSAEAREKLRGQLAANDLLMGTVVSRDFRATALVCQLKISAPDRATLEAVRETIAAVPGPEKVSVGGSPVIRTDMAGGIANDIRKLLPLGLLVMLIFLFVCFRQLRGVFLPFVVVVMSIVFAMGMLPLLGWKLQLITVLLPVILIAVANDYGIHILARYQEENHPDSQLDRPALVTRIVEALGGPVLATALTTVAGLLAMLSHILVPARQVGVLAAAGVTWALLGSLTFIPAVLTVLRKARPRDVSATGGHLLDRALGRVATLVVARPRTVVTSSSVLVGAIALGSFLLTIEMNVVNFFPADSELAKATLLLQEKFGGSLDVAALAKGDIKDPAVLKEIDALEQRLLAMPIIEKSSSIAGVVRKMNESVHGGDPSFDTIPETREAVAELFLLYSMSGDPTDFDRMVDFPYEHALLSARIASLSTYDLESATREVESFIAGHPETVFERVGGFSRLLSSLVKALVVGQLWSLALSLLMVMVLVAILFRSLTAGFISAAPLGAAMAALFGLMGLMGIELNHITALLSSIMIGVGIDYTIHFLWRYREERRTREPAEAVHETLVTTGRGIVFNALSVVVGFAILFSSGFRPIQWFGFLVTVSISAALVAAMVFLPALVLIVRPRFLEPA
ncbi:MAG: MMPL family transporter [Deltaproteobacteria bacterium]|nr:MMPL family transporter [Deltaproteobacteria bacterium]